MKVCVISDSHGRTDRIERVLARHPDVELLIHAGDHAEDARGWPDVKVRAVGGNCDPSGSAPKEEFFDVLGVRVFLTHGHLYKVKQTLLPLSYRANETGADLVVFGHSHVPVITEEKGTILFNPGSLSHPRGAVSVPTYGILTILPSSSGRKLRISLYGANGEEVPGFRFEHTYRG